ncbi:MAG: hypothetical protein QGI37_05470 [Verrucomicrobiota bacterium]|nr:hypothetical protein [Verrucomicrobiota bacterium]MDP7441185.1 hypothetical protein [Verrucomicrobiota bacterium]
MSAVPAALGQVEPVLPKLPPSAEPAQPKPEPVPEPPEPVLPPRTVRPKPAGQGEVEPKRLPADINRLLQPRAGYKTASSRSGQFMAYGPMLPKRRGGILDANANTILIAPDYVVVTAERVRHAMLSRLGLSLLPGSRVKLRLEPAMSYKATVPVVTERHLNGYTYGLTLPSEIEADKLVRALVQVALLDLANQKPQLRDTEIPLWLTVGFTQVLLAQPDLVLVLSRPEQGGKEMAMEEVVKNVRRHDTLVGVRARLRGRRAFDFSEIAMPSPAHLRGENWRDFQACSHLLVDRLLAVPAGGVRLQNMIRQLPNNLNWQTGFLKVYGDLFADMLVVEKWWAVTIVQLTGQNQYQNWTLLEAVEKLENLLKLPAEVRLNDADSPLEAEVTLQQAIRGWDFAVQKQTLQQKINQLLIARVKMPQQLLPFVNEYGRILQNYVVTRQRIESFKPRRGQVRPRIAPVIDEAVRQLDSVDRRLVLFKPESKTPAPATLPQN